MQIKYILSLSIMELLLILYSILRVTMSLGLESFEMQAQIS